MLRDTLREHHIVASALAIAIAAIDRVPDQRDTPGSDRLDMEHLFDAMVGNAADIYVKSAETMMEKVLDGGGK